MVIETFHAAVGHLAVVVLFWPHPEHSDDLLQFLVCPGTHR